MAGNRKTIVISPYLLYFKYHTWYVWAGSDVFGYDKPGPFRLSRMQAVELLSTEEYVPSSQSKGELIKDLKLDYHPANKEKMFDIKLRITGNFVLAARQTKWFDGDNAVLQKDGSLEYTVKLKGLEAITLWVMRSLDSIEVLEPKELRDEIDRRVNVYLARRR
jgi:predicted DNA-binding transcriptional regulator YafY